MLSKGNLRFLVYDWLTKRCQEALTRRSSLISSESDFAIRIRSIEQSPESDTTILTLEVSQGDDVSCPTVSFSVHNGRPTQLRSALGPVLVDTAELDADD